MGSSPREIAAALADGLLADLDRAERSAKLNRGARSVGNVIEGARSLWAAAVLGVAALIGLAIVVPFWLALTLVLFGEAVALGLWIGMRKGRRRRGAHLADADDQVRAALDASVQQLNSLLADLRAEGLELAYVDFTSGNLARLRRDVRDIRARLASG